MLAALRAHGTLGALVDAQRAAGASDAAIEKLERFATELHRLGALRAAEAPSPALAAARG